MDKIDKLFKDGFSEASQTPPGYMWGKISDGLGASSGRKRKMLIWYAAASIAIMAAFTSGYYIATLNSTTNGVVAENVVSENPAVNKVDLSPENNNALTEVKEHQENTPAIEKNSYKSQTIEATETPVHFASGKSKEDQNNQNKEVIVNEKELKKEQIAQVDKGIQKKDAADSAKTEDIAQNNEEKHIDPYMPPIETPKLSKWTIGANAGPQYAYRDVRSQGSNIFLLAGSVPDNFSARSSKSDKSYYDQIESPIIAFSGGVNVNYRATKRFLVESGLYYSRIGQATEEMFVYEESTIGNAGSDYEIINSSAGDVVNKQKSGMLLEDLQESHTYVLNYSPDGSLLYMNSSNLVLNFDYLEVPLILKYKILDKKIDVLVSAGVTTGILIGNNAFVQNENEKIQLGATENIRTMSYSSSTGFAIQYEISEHLAFNVEPVFRYSLRTISKDYYIKSYPYSFQVYSGLIYNF